MNRDVVIYATPTITKDISYNTRDLVIDLGNSVPHPDRFNCPYVNRIGQLTDFCSHAVLIVRGENESR